MNTLLLNPKTWDLMVDVSRNIAVSKEPYALAQDAASAVKLFLGEDYYDISRGVPFFGEILGHWPPVTLMKSHFIRAAKTVPGVVEAQSFIFSIEDRRPRGQVQVTDKNGRISTVGF